MPSSHPGLRVIHILVANRKRTMVVVMVQRTQSKINITGPRFVPSVEGVCPLFPMFAWLLLWVHTLQVVEAFYRCKENETVLILWPHCSSMVVVLAWCDLHLGFLTAVTLTMSILLRTWYVPSLLSHVNPHWIGAECSGSPTRSAQMIIKFDEMIASLNLDIQPLIRAPSCKYSNFLRQHPGDET